MTDLLLLRHNVFLNFNTQALQLRQIREAKPPSVLDHVADDQMVGLVLSGTPHRLLVNFVSLKRSSRVVGKPGYGDQILAFLPG